MRQDIIGKTCEECGSLDDLQEHHISYDPEIKQVLCVTCHKRKHPGHGVGKSDNAPMFDDLKDMYLHLRNTLLNRRSVAAELGISETTAYLWDKRLGLLKPRPTSIRINRTVGIDRGVFAHLADMSDVTDTPFSDVLNNLCRDGMASRNEED